MSTSPALDAACSHIHPLKGFTDALALINLVSTGTARKLNPRPASTLRNSPTPDRIERKPVCRTGWRHEGLLRGQHLRIRNPWV